MDGNIKEMLFLSGVAATIGALTGLGLSFTALSPLVMGGIVAAISSALLVYIVLMNEELSKENLFIGACLFVTGTAIGVGLAATAMAIFPGAVLGIGSAALAGAAIGVIAPTAALFAAIAIAVAAEKVNEYIISPIVERFSSKEEEYNSPAK